MPLVLEEYGKPAHKKLHQLGVAAGVADENDSHEIGAGKFIDAIYELNARMNIPKTLSGIKREDIAAMARHAAKEANPLYPVPRLMSAKELEHFYYKVSERAQGVTIERILEAKENFSSAELHCLWTFA